MTVNPSGLFDEIAKAENQFERRSRELSDQQHAAVEDIRQKVKILRDAEAEARQQAENSIQNTESSTEKEQLLRTKRKNMEQKRELETQIANLQREIDNMHSPSESETSGSSLAILQSIAPVRLSRNDPKRISGMVCLGTPDSTKSFEFDRVSPNAISSGFWAILERIQGEV
jgi:vacuolar-type H+-ATPase subunit H